jgi:hypothetical protein
LLAESIQVEFNAKTPGGKGAFFEQATTPIASKHITGWEINISAANHFTIASSHLCAFALKIIRIVPA